MTHRGLVEESETVIGNQLSVTGTAKHKEKQTDRITGFTGEREALAVTGLTSESNKRRSAAAFIGAYI